MNDKFKPDLILEFLNEDKVQFRDMSEEVTAVMCQYDLWQKVEWYSQDACRWVPNWVCPRQWNKEAYRLPLSAFKEDKNETVPKET